MNVYDDSPDLKEMISNSIGNNTEVKREKEKSSDDDSESYKILKNIIGNMTEKIEKNKKGEIPHRTGKFLEGIMNGDNMYELKCNFHSFGGTKAVYERVVNGEISFLLYALTVLTTTGGISQVTREGFTRFSKDNLDCNKIISPDFCAVVHSTNQGQSSFRTRIIATKTTMIEIKKGYKIEVLIPKIVADIVKTDSGEKWTRKTHSNIVAPHIMNWGSAKPVKKSYFKFRARMI
jgi:hypothetical protein